jgi:beta-phosphoglucomutase
MPAIIFDLDGVLIDSMKYHALAWQFAFKQFGITVSHKKLYSYEGMTGKQTIDAVAKGSYKSLTAIQKKKIYTAKQKKMAEIFKIKIYPDVLDLLKYLKKLDFQLAIVTGANKKFATSIINKKFKNIFDVIIVGEDTAIGKPSPKPYLKALSLLRTGPQNTLVIENAPLGIKSAKGARLRVLALTTTLPRKELASADLIFPNHKKILGHFKAKPSTKIFKD